MDFFGSIAFSRTVHMAISLESSVCECVLRSDLFIMRKCFGKKMLFFSRSRHADDDD